MTIGIKEKSSYVSTFITAYPRNGIDSPHARLLSALKLNEEFAEYFKDRAQIEDAYAKSIAKLMKKNYISNKSALGTFLPIWETLHNELSQLATIHSEYSTIVTEQIEKPLKMSILNNPDYTDTHELNSHLQKIARGYDDLENKIQKHKKSTKSEGKVAEYMKQQEKKLAEWNRDAPEYLKKHQNIDEFRLENLKNMISKFEYIQKSRAEKIIKLAESSIAVETSLSVNDEIDAFCTHHTHPNSNMSYNNPTIIEPLTENSNQLINIVPEPSVSSTSLKVSKLTSSSASFTKKEKKRFLSSFVSMRRKTKSSPNNSQNEYNTCFEKTSEYPHVPNNEENMAGSISIRSTNTHSTAAEYHDNDNMSSKGPNEHNIGDNNTSATLSNSSLEKNNSFTDIHSSQPPLIVVDEEGYSIPPPNREIWMGDTNTTNDSLIDTEDVSSEGGSLFSNPRIRVDIKNETIKENDASQSAVALTRVSTLLKEKNVAGLSTRKPRGRREIRTTQLYSVAEQVQPLSQSDKSSVNETPIISTSSSALFNPFEASQEKLDEVVHEVPSIDVNVTETIHALSKGGISENILVWGKISIQYKGPTESEIPICFKLNCNERLESIETTDYVDVLDGYSVNDTIFKINTHLFYDKEGVNEHVMCIKYQTRLNNDYLPLIIKPMWKCDLDKSRLLVKYHKNINISTMSNVIFATSITSDVQNASSIPTGELILSQKRMGWHIGQISNDVPENELVIKAQFITLQQASPQPIAARFEVEGQLLTDLTLEQGVDPVLYWAKICNVTKIMKAGKYIAEV